jgi:ppGpp synthetase/RelA/SpoT-type nucleotidyltranferase
MALSKRDKAWARRQVKEFAARRPMYVRYAEVLEQILEGVVRDYDPHAIVQARAKTISSFAEKIWRKRDAYRYPVNQLTDLCGARVILHTPHDVEAVSEFIKRHFTIDWDNSQDVKERLEPSQFGYRSVHYIVQLRPDSFPTVDIGVKLPPEGDALFGLKAEVQVRTMLEHAWADVTHSMSYKAEFDTPPKWERALAGVAAALERADDSFSTIRDGLEAYSESFGAYMEPPRMREQIARLEIALEHDPENAELAGRIGRLANVLGDWDTAERVLAAIASDRTSIEQGRVPLRDRPILRDLGHARCMKYGPGEAEFAFGQTCLERAAAPPDRDVEALLALAASWRRVPGAGEEVRRWSREAYDADPLDPYALSGHLDQEIAYQRDLAFVRSLRPQLEAAVRRCREQADVGVNLPHAFFVMGKLELLLDRLDRGDHGEPSLDPGPQPAERYRSVIAYAKGGQLSSSVWPIRAALDSLELLEAVQAELEDYESVRRLLLLAMASKTPASAEERKLVREAQETVAGLGTGTATGEDKAIDGPVVIVVGGCDRSVDKQMREYRGLMLKALRDVRCTIISGGTREGVGGLVGTLQARYPNTVHAIGYVPAFTPSDAHEDGRYAELRRTDSHGFGVREPLQNWIDVVASGIHPSQVKVLGINGGAIAAAEYRIALALGARVAVIEHTGRAAARLFADPDWRGSALLVQLPRQAETLRAYLGSRLPSRDFPDLDPDDREQLARAIHEKYRRDQQERKPPTDPSMAEWGLLPDGLRDSNRQQADYTFAMLDAIGCTARRVRRGQKPRRPRFKKKEDVEVMAEMEHERWNMERIFGGWTWASDRDVANKRSPHLVLWPELADEIKRYDREAVEGIPENLAQVGLEARRERRAPQPGDAA